MKVQRPSLKVIAGSVAVAGVLAVAGLTGFGGTASAGSEVSGTTRTVTATAQGSATGVPDQLTANVGGLFGLIGGRRANDRLGRGGELRSGGRRAADRGAVRRSEPVQVSEDAFSDMAPAVQGLRPVSSIRRR